MSTHDVLKSRRRVTVPALRARKGTTPIVCLTAYTAPMARLLDPAVDVLLVGDSMGMVLYGMPNTLGVTLEMMLAHTKAVSGASQLGCVIADLPFGTYQQSPAQAFASAARLVAEGGAAGVKLEGGAAMAETIRFLTQRGIPVMGHVGLVPQSVNALGGYAARGRQSDEADTILRDALAIEEAGAFAIVVEGVLEPLARRITAQLRIPTIGIGASAACDGQVLVTEDMLGLTGAHVPRFVRSYAQLDVPLSDAVAAYAEDVRQRRFPGPAEVYKS
jgi:3-methyl-2-oxobutanoate hydroxymethyltransferase